MILRFNILLLVFFSFLTLTSAQFSINDRELAATTFARKFNKEIIIQYLNSDYSDKTNAALLSISHSKDTSYIELIKNLDYKNHFNFIDFTLGQLGENRQSAEYLKDKIINSNFTSISTYEALGKSGDISDYNFLINYFEKENNDEIVLGLYNFYLRNIYDERYYEILKVIISDSENINSKTYSAFALFRAKPDSSFIPIIIDELEKIDNIHESNETLVRYLLNTLKKLQFSPEDYLLTKFISSKNWTVQLSAVELLKYQKTIDKVFFTILLNLFDSENNNLLKIFISELSKINFTQNQKELVIEHLKILYNETESDVIKGEIVLALINLSEKDFPKSKLSELNKEYLYKSKALLIDKNNLLLELQKDFKSENEIGKMIIANTLLQYKEELQDFYFKTMNENSPILISISADALNIPFIQNNNEKVKELIIRITNKNLNDANYVESLMSLFNLSKKISVDFSDSLKFLISNSMLYSNKVYTVDNITELKDTSMFNLFWNNAFKYNGAEIVTDKGSFNIKFLSGYAPITVGNFVYSALTGVYRNTFFHRVVPSFVIQGGDPTGTGWGGPGHDIISEFSPLYYKKGMVGMASSGKDTEGSQFFVMQAEHPHLNGRYTIFGEVIDNYEVFENIEQYDKILKITLY